jgi:tetratricopeptide (TPR) repeat protein
MFMRAKVLEKQQKFCEAIGIYSQVLTKDPCLVNAAYGKAACENRLGLFENAINTYEAAFSQDQALPEHIPSPRISTTKPCHDRVRIVKVNLTSQNKELF